jgi:hypothetical protein
MNIAVGSFFLSILLSGCSEVLELSSFFLADTYYHITNDVSVALRGSCANPHEGQVGVKIVAIDERTASFNPDNESPWSISKGQHLIGIKLGHLRKIQKLTLEFSSKHRYLLSATFNRDTNKYQTYFWDESKYPAKKLSSFEFEATPNEIWQEKLEQFNCNADR